MYRNTSIINIKYNKDEGIFNAKLIYRIKMCLHSGFIAVWTSSLNHKKVRTWSRGSSPASVHFLSYTFKTLFCFIKNVNITILI